MTPKMQAQLIAVYKHFAKHPNRADAQLSFVRQVDKCLTDHGYELWTEDIGEGEKKNQLWYCAKCGFCVTYTKWNLRRYYFPCPHCGNPWWNFTRTRPVKPNRSKAPKDKE